MDPSSPPKYRKRSLILFLVSMPITVLDSHGPGMFVDPNGWQGFDVAFFWPLCVLMLGAWWFIPIGLATAYIVCGMWLQNTKTIIHVLGAASCVLSVLLLVFGGEDRRFGILFLGGAWVFAALAAIRNIARQTQNVSIGPPSQTPAVPPESN